VSAITDREIGFSWMQAQLGAPYIWGGNHYIGGLGGYDCSGLAQAFYTMFGIDPPGDQTSQAYYDHFVKHQKAGGCMASDVRFGDMLFFGDSEDKISHIAIGVNHTCMFEAGGGNKGIKNATNALRIGACSRFSPITRRNDLIEVWQVKQF